MRIPLLRRGDYETPIAWWEWLFFPLGFCLGLLFFLVASVLAIPVAIVWVVVQRIRERRFAQMMRDRNRFITWDVLEPRLQSGNGTLIVEQANKAGIRAWWVEDDVQKETPVKLPAEKDLDFMLRNSPDPFELWCFDRYLDAEKGQARLTELPFSFPPGFAESKSIIEKYPHARVVMTVKRG